MNNNLQLTTYNLQLSRYWLLIGVGALAIAGLFALELLVGRTSDIPLFAALFHEALVVHVDLSVLVWFLAIACLTWSLLVAGTPSVIPLLEEAALFSFGLGTLAIAASPMDSKAEALMSNYIPVITSPVFFMGLSLLLCGVALMLVRVLFAYVRRGNLIGFATISSAFIALIAIIAFVWSFHQMPGSINPATDGAQYYEILFWGGGHVLQFLHTQILLICWCLMLGATAPDILSNWMSNVKMRSWLPSSSINPLKVIFIIAPIAALVTPGIYLFYNVASDENRQFFTHSMIMVGGIAPILLALYLIPTLWNMRHSKNALWSSMVMSILLFMYGGLLGEMIRGQNVVIPAHYHGSIVGVTLAFMGAAYMFLPQLGYKDVSNWRMAFWQPIVSGGGQFMHISGLAYSGGYGVLRKTPGGLEGLAPSVKAAMGIMEIGGLIAIVGGFMFIIVVGKSVFSGKERIKS